MKPEQQKVYHKDTDDFPFIVEQLNDILSVEEITNLSPQLKRSLENLLDATCCLANNERKFSSKLSTVFSRLLLELVQAHYNTKQREQDLIKLIKGKGCLLDPELVDSVIELLIQLYKKAPGQFADTSYERNVLLLFLCNKLSSHEVKKDKELGKIIQTLYRCDCFQIIKMEDAPARLKLKVGLLCATDIRKLHDEGLIKMAQTSQPPIRLPPERWTNLLYHSDDPDTQRGIQSLLSKHQVNPTVQELELSITKVGDRYGIAPYINKLHDLESLINRILSMNDDVQIVHIDEVVRKLAALKHLFIIRQSRRHRIVVQHDLFRHEASHSK